MSFYFFLQIEDLQAELRHKSRSLEQATSAQESAQRQLKMTQESLDSTSKDLASKDAEVGLSKLIQFVWSLLGLESNLLSPTSKTMPHHKNSLVRVYFPVYIRVSFMFWELKTHSIVLHQIALRTDFRSSVHLNSQMILLRMSFSR